MKNKIMLVGILTIILAVFAISTASAMSEYYLVPDNSGVQGYGNTVEVQLRLNATQEFQAGKVTLMYDTPCAYIALTGFIPGPEWEDKTRASYPGEYIMTYDNFDEWGIPVNLSAGDYLIGTYTIQCNSTTPCVTDLILPSSSPHSPTWACDICALYVPHVPFTVDDGTFACTAPEETFSKPLAAGWNLISLPLTSSNISAAKVLETVSYDAVYRYSATAPRGFESVATMDPGVGYFVHVTASEQTWTYNGSAYTSMNVSLAPGLNMVGGLNCSKSVSDALSSLDGKYNYVAMFNATSQRFEAYNPHAPSVFNDFDTMERGTGYFISARAGCPRLDESCTP